MAAPARSELGGQTLARKWWLDVNEGTHASPVWTPVNGIAEIKPSRENTMQDDSDGAANGAKSQVATAYSWQIELKLQRKVKVADASVYDDGQEAIRAAADETGLANVLEIRFYEMNINDAGEVVGPTEESYQGYVAATYSPDGGAMDALDSASVILYGRGDRNAVEHPEGS